MLREKRGQSTLEYIAVFAAIVGAIVVLAYTTLKPSVQKVLDSAAEKINQSAANFSSNST